MPVYKDQIIVRNSARIRVFIQKSSTGKPGRRLLEQIEDTRL